MVSVYLTQYIDDAVLEAAKAGSVIVLLQNSSTPQGVFSSTPTRFKQAWWLGSATRGDIIAGTVVYDGAKTLFGAGMAPQGFADQTWYRLVEGAETFLVDDINISPARPEVLMRAIDIVGLSRNKALLFELPFGNGHIIGTGLNAYQEGCTKGGCPMPEKAWVLDRLIRYGGDLLQTRGR